MKLKIETTDLSSIQTSFSQIANQLINKHVISANGTEYRPVNLEFYYYNEECHQDKNSHARKPKSRSRERQILSGQWYLHHRVNRPTDRRKGIDFTFGDGKSYGGILIKKALRTSDNVIFSQSKFIDELSSALKPTDEFELLSMIEEHGKLGMKHDSSLSEYKVSCAPRIGLPKDTFKNSNYAFKVEGSF